MKAYLIDPEIETISEIELGDDYKEICDLVADGGPFDVVRNAISSGDDIFIDDEGMLKDPDYFFYTEVFPPVAGKGIVLGCDKKGDSVEPSISLEKLRQEIKFCNYRTAYAMHELAYSERKRQARELKRKGIEVFDTGNPLG